MEYSNNRKEINKIMAFFKTIDTNWMQEIARKHNELFDNHKVTSVYANDMTSGYAFDDIDDMQHKVEQIDLQEHFYDEDEGEDSTSDYRNATLEEKAYALNELITAQNEGI